MPDSRLFLHSARRVCDSLNTTYCSDVAKASRHELCIKSILSERLARQKTVDFAYSAQHSVYIRDLFPDVRFVRPLAGLIVKWAEARSQPAAQVDRGSERQ